MTDTEPDKSGGVPCTSVSTLSFQENLALLNAVKEAYGRYLQCQIERKLLLTRREFSRAIAVNESELDAALIDGRFITVTIASGETFYPKFLAQPDLYPADALNQVTDALSRISDSKKYYFLTSPSHFLGGHSPIEKLATGDLCAVLTAARAFAES